MYATKELSKLDQMNQISAKLSGSLRNLAIKMNHLNMQLPEDKRLEKLIFD